MKILSRIIGVLFFLVISLGCGKRGDPKAPEVTAPKSVRFFTARGAVDGIQLSWQAPEETASGDELLDLSGFVVHRSVYAEDENPHYKEVGEIEISRNKDTDIAQYSKQTVFSYKDKEVKPGTRYQYYVAPINDDGVEGEAPQIIRVLFAGESSTVESF